MAYTISETFDKSVDLKELADAATHGRTERTCESMRCDVVQGPLLRTVSTYAEDLWGYLRNIFFV